MSNLFVENPTYITLEEIKWSTKDDCVKKMSDENLKILIRKWEIIIDDIIKEFWEKESPDQVTIFPTVKDQVPLSIKKAVVLLVEWLHLWWELEVSSNGPIKWWMIKQEKFWDHSITYQDEWVRSNALQSKNKYITSEIEVLIRPYIKSVWVRFSKWI